MHCFFYFCQASQDSLFHVSLHPNMLQVGVAIAQPKALFLSFYQVGLAGKDWLLGFHRRHPQLVIRIPEATSAARTKLFNPKNGGKFFDISSLAQADLFFFLCTGFSMSMRQVLQRCKILILPPHCSHRMQPLDVSFIKLLDAYYVKAVETLLRNSPGRQVTVYKLSCYWPSLP